MQLLVDRYFYIHVLLLALNQKLEKVSSKSGSPYLCLYWFCDSTGQVSCLHSLLLVSSSLTMFTSIYFFQFFLQTVILFSKTVSVAA